MPAFLQAVAAQPWARPDAVLLVLKNEGEGRFTAYRPGPDGALAAIG